MIKKNSTLLKGIGFCKTFLKSKEKTHISILVSLIGIYIYAIVSFSFLFYWTIVDRVGSGAAYSIDQLTPFAMAIIFSIFLIRKKTLQICKKLFSEHILSIVAITITTFFVRIWVLGFYFFGEDPTTVLTSVTNNNKEYLISIIRRGYPFSLYISSYMLFGIHTFFYGLVTFIIYLFSVFLLYILLDKFFQKKIIALIGTLLYVTTPAYLDMFYWQGLAPGMILALVMGFLTMIYLLQFQQTHRKSYYIASILFFIAMLKICFVRMIGFIVPLSFLTFFSLYSFKINIKRSVLYTFSFLFLWFLFFFIVFLIPYGIPQKIAYTLLPQLNTAKETTMISVRGEPLNTHAYFVSFSTLMAYLFLPSEIAKTVYPVLKNIIISIFVGAYNPSLTFIFGSVVSFILIVLSVLGIIKLPTKLKWILLFGIIFLVSNLFYVPLFTIEYHNLISLDAMFSMDSPGYGPGIRYVYVSSVGLSVLLGLTGYIVLKKLKKFFNLYIVLITMVLFYGAVLNIKNQLQSIKDMTPQKVVPDQIFQMVPKNGEKKILFSSNPVRNAIDAKIGGPLWLNAFYTFNELSYSNNLTDFMQRVVSEKYQKSNIYAFYNNPYTFAFKNISALAKYEMYSRDVKPLVLIPTLTLHSEIYQSMVNDSFLIRRGEYSSSDLNQRFFLPRTLTFTIQKQIESFSNPYYDLYIFSKNSSAINYPFSLWELMNNGPIFSNADELSNKLSLPIDHTRLISTIPIDEKLQIVNILDKREKFRQEAKVAVSSIEQGNNNVSKTVLLDGIYTPKVSPEKGIFYRASESPATISIVLPEQITLGRMLLNVPPGSLANQPVDVDVLDTLNQQTLASVSKLTAQDWSPNDGSMFQIPLQPSVTNAWNIIVKKTTHNPVMLDDITLDPVEATLFTPRQIFEDKFASFHYIDSQSLLSTLLGNQEFNSLTLFYACAESGDWKTQQKDMSVEIPGIWKMIQIPMHNVSQEQLSTQIDCNGSVLRKLIFVSPAYPGSFQINNVIVAPGSNISN